MISKDYLDLVDKLSSTKKEIHLKKSHDYATDSDVLSNFKRNGQMLKTLQIPELYLKNPAIAQGLSMLILKVDRIINLLSKNEAPKNESVEDSFIDASNYLDLSYGLYKEATE